MSSGGLPDVRDSPTSLPLSNTHRTNSFYSFNHRPHVLHDFPLFSFPGINNFSGRYFRNAKIPITQTKKATRFPGIIGSNALRSVDRESRRLPKDTRTTIFLRYYAKYTNLQNRISYTYAKPCLSVSWKNSYYASVSGWKLYGSTGRFAGQRASW